MSGFRLLSGVTLVGWEERQRMLDVNFGLEHNPTVLVLPTQASQRLAEFLYQIPR